MSNFGDHPAGFFGVSDFYNGVATQSLRFDDGSNAYLTKTFGSDGTGSGATCTVSCWVKRTTISNSDQWFFTAGSSSPAWILGFRTNDNLAFGDDDANPFVTVTNRVFRDTSAWYHIVLRVKTSESANADKYKIYVNGELQATTFSGTAADTLLGANVVHNIGRYPTGSVYFDGYMAEVNFVDGLALDASYFGETKNGVWIPKEPDVSEYGTNGFRFKFDQVGVGTASTSTIGADTSGKTNHFTSSGIVASDCDMPDSPENNFATFGVLNSNTNTTLSEGGLRALMGGSNNYDQVRSDFGLSSGKWYWEIYVEERGYVPAVGVFAGYKGNNTNPNHWVTFGFGGWFIANNSSIPQYNVNQNSSGGTNWSVTMPSNGDVIMIAIDVDDNKIWWGLNGTWYNSSGTANPATGTDPRVTLTSNQTWHPMATLSVGGGGYSNEKIKINFGQDDTFAGAISATGNTDGNGVGVFKYAPPSGYLALCTANLPEPTISPNETTQADDHFDTLLHTADGSAGAFTGADFQPDWIWAKNRTNAYSHELWDSSRGVNSDLQSDNANAEITGTGRLVSFDSGGFSYGTSSNLYVNNTASVAWLWKANGGTTTTNDASATSIGSIDSVIQANTDAGFSIVTYTGTGSNATVGHGLGAVARMVIIKNRDQADNWAVGHTDIGFSKHLQLNVSDGATSASAVFNSTAPTSTVFSIGSNHKTNASSENYVAYCFAEVEGYSKFGKYTGNLSTDGTFVYTGFRPAWLLIKNADENGYNWYIYDNKRLNYNPNSIYSTANTNGVETNYSGDSVDFLSNGFKLRTLSNGRGTNRNANHIYMAFAEAPFKYANAR